MSTAIVPAKVAQILPLEVFTIERGGRNSVLLPSGNIASDIELVSYNERRRIACYELRVANESASVLACYAYAVRGGHGTRPVTCTSIAVLPFSGVAVTFELPLPFIGNYDRITVEMHGDGIDLSSDTIPPGRDYRVLVRRSVILAAVVLATLVTAIAGLVSPHIIAVAAPAEALGGTTVDIAYEAHGFGTIEYHLIAPDGSLSGSGTTRAQTGTVPFRLPPVPVTRAYMASLQEHNLFGGDARTVVIKDIATPPPRMLTLVREPAAIRALAVDRSHVPSGSLILVRYNYVGQTGMLRLLDENDGVWAAAPLDAKGLARFSAPHVDRVRAMRVALHIEKDATSADSVVGVTVVPATPAPIAYKPLGGAPLEIVAKPLLGGDAILLRVTKRVADLRIALQDEHGQEIEGFNVDGEQTALHAPDDARGGRYTIVATYTDHNGQETVVTPITIGKRK
jgi:hypothetical protein